jgi:hypothetical protein
MRLNKGQKELVLEWIAEGLQTDEINKRARLLEPPFSVGRSQVRFYRRTRGKRMDQIRSQAEDEALIAGFTTAEGRVSKLARLAALLEEDIFREGLSWTHQVKGIGPKGSFERIDYDEFNGPEIAQYRGILDDIAKETGGRVLKQQIEEEVSILWDLPVPGFQPPSEPSE